MKYLTLLQNKTPSILCLLTIFSTGCVAKFPEFPAYQRVNRDLLEQSKKRTFKLGIVEAVGSPMDGQLGSLRLENKKSALEKVPIVEICSLLSSKYSITIDTAVDKTSKVVKEGCDVPSAVIKGSMGTNVKIDLSKNIYSWTDNAYYGNFVYENISDLRTTWFGCSDPEPINAENFPDFVNVTYSFDYDFFYYDIEIISSGQEILNMHGIVGNLEMGSTWDERWFFYVDHASGIGAALKRDLSEKIETANTVSVQEMPESSKQAPRPVQYVSH